MRRKRGEIGSEELEADCVRYNIHIVVDYRMPIRIKGYTTTCGSGYLVMINGQQDDISRIKTFLHELAHIKAQHLASDIPRDIMESQAVSFAHHIWYVNNYD